MLAHNVPQMHSERETLMRTLASRLDFSVEEAGGRFRLLRTAAGPAFGIASSYVSCPTLGFCLNGGFWFGRQLKDRCLLTLFE